MKSLFDKAVKIHQKVMEVKKHTSEITKKISTKTNINLNTIKPLLKVAENPLVQKIALTALKNNKHGKELLKNYQQAKVLKTQMNDVYSKYANNEHVQLIAKHSPVAKKMLNMMNDANDLVNDIETKCDTYANVLNEPEQTIVEQDELQLDEENRIDVLPISKAKDSLPSRSISQNKTIIIDINEVTTASNIMGIKSCLTASSGLWSGEKDIYYLEGETALCNLYSFTFTIALEEDFSFTSEMIKIKGILNEQNIMLYGYVVCANKYFLHEQLFCKITIAPKIHTLKLNGKNRIFENKTVIEIITAVLDEMNILYQMLVELDYPAQNYIIQYQEDNWSFLKSIILNAGISFTFNFQDENTVLILFDNIDNVMQVYDNELQYNLFQTDNYHNVMSYENHQHMHASGYHASNYDYTQADQRQKFTAGQEPFLEQNCNNVDIRMQNNNLQNYHIIQAKIFILPATKISVLINQNKQNLMSTKINYHFLLNENNNAFTFHTIIKTIQADVLFQEFLPNKKRTHLHSGIVIGPEGQEIYSDEFGRVRVRFFWDEKYLQNDIDVDNTCWMRVMHKGSSGMSHFFVPRIGDEVVIDFENGDINKPIVIGTVYNSQNFIAHDPSSTDVSYWRMKKEQEDVYNEISMCASADTASLNITACKDMNMNITNNYTQTIAKGNYDLSNTEGNYDVTVTKGNLSNTITKGNVTNTLDDGNYELTITKGNVDVSLTKGNLSTSLTKGNITNTLTKGNLTNTLSKGDNKLDITGNNTTTVSQKNTMTVTGNEVYDVKKNRTTTISKNDKLTISGGNYTIEISGGKLTINASASILHKAPQITLTSTGTLTLDANILNLKGKSMIKMEAPQIKCTAAAALELKGGGSVKIEGAATEIKGAMVKIN